MNPIRQWNSRNSALRGRLAPLAAALPLILFVISTAVIAFMAGYLFTEKKWFPYSALENARKTMHSVYQQLFPPFAPLRFMSFSGGSVADASRNRIIVKIPAPASAMGEHFLMAGGAYEYLGYCPGQGCIAAEFTRGGALVHAYPYRPASLEAHVIAAEPYEQIFFNFTENLYPLGMLKLPGGDLIVTFQQWNMFPFAGGIARIRPDGSAVWFRHDYSHHWPRLLPSGEIAVTAMRVGPAEVTAPLGPDVNIDLACEGKIEEDVVHILDTGGRLKEEIPVFDAILHSPWRGMLFEAPVPCAPLHLNYVAPVTRGITTLYPDVAPDDLIISLRDLNAFGIIGRHDHRLKHMFTGTFLRQHSVQPLGQSATVLIFDDHGADWKAGPSRLLAYDLATHRERTLFPSDRTPGIRMFSDVAGNISVSPDLNRIVVASTWSGRAYEIRIADGTLLTVFNNVHDLRSVESAGKKRAFAAGRFALGGVYYVH